MYFYFCNRFLSPTPKPITLGSIFSSGTSTSSMAICPVMLALSENFPSIFGAVRPFIPFSRINPRILSLSLSHLPHTIKTSAIGEFVILKKNKNIHLSKIYLHMTVLCYMYSTSSGARIFLFHLNWLKCTYAY